MKKTVLVAEDNPLFRELIALDLQENGVEVRTASSGDDVLQILQEDHPHLIVLDLLLPGLSGLGVLEHLRRQKLQIPVVVLSGALVEFDSARLLRDPVRECIDKTALDGNLWERVRKYLV